MIICWLILMGGPSFFINNLSLFQYLLIKDTDNDTFTDGSYSDMPEALFSIMLSYGHMNGLVSEKAPCDGRYNDRIPLDAANTAAGYVVYVESENPDEFNISEVFINGPMTFSPSGETLVKTSGVIHLEYAGFAPKIEFADFRITFSNLEGVMNGLRKP